MKTLLLIPIFLLCIFHPSQAQSDSVIPKKIFRIWIKPIEKRCKMEGALFEIKDSSIIMSNSLKKQDYFQGILNISKFDIQLIEGVEIIKKKNYGTGAWIGANSGFVVGGMVPSKESGRIAIMLPANEALVISVPIIVIFSVIDAIIGYAFPTKPYIPYTGSLEKFDMNNNELKSYSIKYYDGRK